MTRQETEEIFTAIDDLTTKLHATLDSGKVAAKSLVMILLERLETPSQATQQDNEFLTVKQVADKLKVSTNAIYQWVEKKDFPALRAGDDLRFDMDEVIGWMKRHRKTVEAARLRVVKSQPSPMRLQPDKGAQ